MTLKELKEHKRKIVLDIENMEREYEKSKTNHILHVILSIVSSGFWLFGWLIISLTNLSKRKKLERLITESKHGVIKIEGLIDDKQEAQ